MRKMSKGQQVFNVINMIIMLFLIVICLYPILYVVFASVSNPRLFARFNGAVLWHPLGFSLASYKEVFRNANIVNGYRNTIIVVVVGVSLNLLMTILAGYVLSRNKLMLRRFLNLFVMFTMYFSGGTIPLYLIVRDYGLTDTLASLILPVALNTFNLIIMRTAFEGVPTELEEAARVDGASHLTIMTRIMVPLVKPTLAVLVLYYGVYHWNAWFNALLFIRSRTLYPLQLLLRELLIEDTAAQAAATTLSDDALTEETIKYATIVVATLPILCLYPFLQKYFVKGVMVGAVKG